MVRDPVLSQDHAPTRSRLRRWGRRLLLALLVLVLLVTLAAVVYDLATNGREQPASALYHGPFARVDGTTLAYRSWGSRGSPVVLLGGAAEPSWVWHDVGPLLARGGHRVFALDLPPFGYSQRRGPYTMSHWLQLVRGFEQRLHIERPVLVGHSLGAGVAAAAGLAHPHRVAGVVLLDGDALAFGGNHAWLSDLLVYPYYTAAYRLITGSDWIVVRALRNAWGPKPAPTGHATLAQFERPFRVEGTDSALKQLFAGGIPGVTLHQLAELRVPRAVVWGRRTTSTRSPAAGSRRPSSTRACRQFRGRDTSRCSRRRGRPPGASWTSSRRFGMGRKPLEPVCGLS